jgi:hypothetical protein
MSTVFSDLAAIIVWILFFGGFLGLISRMIFWFRKTGFTCSGDEMAQLALQFVYIAIWLVSAVVVMKLRQMLG